MPKVTARDDGTWFIRASPYPGSGEVRTWEVTQEVVDWLRRQGIGIGQEMGRFSFQQLLDLRYAYVAKRSTKRKTSKTTKPGAKITIEIASGPTGKQRKSTIDSRVLGNEDTSPRKRKHRKNHQRARPEPTPNADITAPQADESTASMPEHWGRRTKKKNWFV